MSKLVNDAYDTLVPYVPGKPVSETKRELGLNECVKLASNENPLGPSPLAVAAISAALPNLHDYPDGGAYYLKEGLSTFSGFPTEQIIVGNGTNEIIEMIVRTCLRPEENIIYAQSSFIVYKLCAQAIGAHVREVPMKDLRFDLPAMAQAIDSHTKVVFVANPNNPTGTYVSRSELDEFLAAIPEHVLVVLDEAYCEYVDAIDYPNGFDYIRTRERLIVMRTFSKCYGLAGLRIGYGVGSPVLIDYLNRGRQPFNVNSLAQVGALAALDDQEHVRRSCVVNQIEMARLVPAFREMGFGVTESQANFLLVDFMKDGQVMFDRLMRLGVIVRPMGMYGLPTSARITIGTPEQNDTLLRALGCVLKDDACD